MKQIDQVLESMPVAKRNAWLDKYATDEAFGVSVPAFTAITCSKHPNLNGSVVLEVNYDSGEVRDICPDCETALINRQALGLPKPVLVEA